MLTHCSGHMELISEHFYEGEKENILEHIAQIPQSIKLIAYWHRNLRKRIKSLGGKDIRIAMDEWNYWYGPYIYGELGVRYYMKGALGIAAGLHEFFRNTDIIFMA
jgi:alpha-N-arabinofuranosidase